MANRKVDREPKRNVRLRIAEALRTLGMPLTTRDIGNLYEEAGLTRPSNTDGFFPGGSFESETGVPLGRHTYKKRHIFFDRSLPDEQIAIIITEGKKHIDNQASRGRNKEYLSHSGQGKETISES